MYSVYINEGYAGSFATAAEAMVHVDEAARPYGSRWKVTDPFGNLYAQS